MSLQLTEYNNICDISNILKRRMRKDIEFLYKKQQNNNLYKLLSYSDHLIKLRMKFINKYLCVVFHFTKAYPWKVPNVLINGRKYINILAIPNDLLKTVGIYNTCLCCSTYACGNNWSPIIKLTKLVEEIEQNIIMKRRIVDKIFCKYIIKKYFWLPYPLPISDFL